MRRFCLLTLALTLCVSIGRSRADWPTLHADSQRSGYVADRVEGPYERKWFRNFEDELMATRVEAIVADGKVYVGTLAGKVHALDIADGRTVWTHATDGPIGHSPRYIDGKLLVSSDDGTLSCLRSADGEVLWSYEAGAGIWVHPACDGEAVYFGDRGGTFHAVRLADGEKLWALATGYMILTPASITPDGTRILFASDDMHVYCVSPTGELLWKKGPVGGLSLRDHAPTLWKDLAILRSNPAHDFHGTFGMFGKPFIEFHKSLPMADGDEVIDDRWGKIIMSWTPRRHRAEMAFLREYLADHPAEQTFHVFDQRDGSRPWLAPIGFTVGLHSPASPPTFHRETGELYTWATTSLNAYAAGVPGGTSAVVTVDRDTGDIHPLDTDRLSRGVRERFGEPSDETQSLSLMDGILINTHQGSLHGIELDSMDYVKIIPQRDSYGGIFGVRYNPTRPPLKGFTTQSRIAHRKGKLVQMANEWHGPDRSIVAVSDDRLFWVVGSQVVCVAGPDVPAAETGGASPPGDIQRKRKPVVPGGNVATDPVGTFDAALPVEPMTEAEVRQWVRRSAIPDARPDSPAVRDARRKLVGEVEELISREDWAPFVVELGISGEEIHFTRTGQTMQILALALPHLPAGVRARAIAYLDTMLAGGMPLDRPAWGDPREGTRREYHLIPDDLFGDSWRIGKLLPGDQPTLADAYALWACAEYASRWDQVLQQADRIEALLERTEPLQLETKDRHGRSVSFHDDWRSDSAERANRRIAGLLGAARILDRAGRDDAANEAIDRLQRLLTVRIHHERADTRYVRSTGQVTHNPGHAGKIPRYVGLVPELSALLADRAGDTMRPHVTEIGRQLPVWYHAFGERLMGGENYINPPHLSRGLFAIWADGLGAGPEQLMRWVDQPWCRADLYYIEKLSAVLRSRPPAAGQAGEGS